MREEEGRGSEEEGKVGVGGEESGREVGCVEEGGGGRVGSGRSERRGEGGGWGWGLVGVGGGVGVGVAVCVLEGGRKGGREGGRKRRWWWLWCCSRCGCWGRNGVKLLLPGGVGVPKSGMFRLFQSKSGMLCFFPLLSVHHQIIAFVATKRDSTSSLQVASRSKQLTTMSGIFVA